MGLFDAIAGVWQNQQNIRMQQNANSMNYGMWQAEMKYNEPVNQVARLKEAGLNPALMYGTGSQANVAPGAPNIQAARNQGLPEFNLDPGAVVQLQQARLIGKQAQLVDEQKRGLRLENDVIAGSPGSLKKDSAIMREGRKLYNEASNSSVAQKAKRALESIRRADDPFGSVRESITPAWMQKVQRWLETPSIVSPRQRKTATLSEAR